MTNTILNAFRLTVLEQKLNVYGVRLTVQGKGVISHRWRSDDPVCIYSGSKAFTSVGIGICADEGRLSLDDRILDFFPEHRDRAAEGTEKITVRHLLHMASGKEGAGLWCEDREDALTADWARLYMEQPLDHEPGAHFLYCGMNTYMLGRIVEKVSGETLRDYLVPRLFTPLGIPNPQWHRCPQGHTICASRLYLTTAEFEKLGILLLQNGAFGGKQLVSGQYLQAAAGDVIDTSACPEPEMAQGYGYQFWRCTRPGTWRADGMYGQYSIVAPDKQAVVTVTSHEETRTYDIVRAVQRDILDTL